VLRVTMRYTPAFYVPLALLHASLAVRVAGDVADRLDWLRAGALGNAAAIALFVATALVAVVRGGRAQRRPQ
jgi:uncharacterized membrane protein